MSAPVGGRAAGELVPLADRLRYMLAFRVLAVVGVAFASDLARGHLLEPASRIRAVSAVFLGAALLTHVAWRITRRRGTTLFGLMLLVDGAYLAWAAYAAGGAGSPVRYLIVLEVLAVSLLASYRTGIRLAIWQSLLVVAVYYGQRSGVLTHIDAAHRTNLIGTPRQQTIAFVVVLWVVALATAAFSAVNERELRRRRADLEALARLTERLERESEPRRVAEALLRSVVDTFAFPRVAVVGSRYGERFAVLACRGTAPPDGPAAPLAPGSVLEVAARTRATELVSSLDPAADAWLDALLPGARNLVVVPLTAEGGTLGALVVEHHARVGSRIERRLVKAVERFAAHGALALRNAWLLEEVRELAAKLSPVRSG
jgi:hypothetical protein